MNVFTLTAAGLVALGVPLAAPWLAQQSTQEAPATTTAPVTVLNLRDAFASTTPVASSMEVVSTAPRAAAGAQERRVASLERAAAPEPQPPTIFTLESSLQDDAARQIAELQARIAALQAEVAALSGHPADGEMAATRNKSAFDALLHEQSRAALESALVDQRDAAAQAELLLQRGMLSRSEAAKQRADAEARVAQALELQRAAEEHALHDRQAMGELRRAEREAQRALEARLGAQRRSPQIDFDERRRAHEEQHARHAEAIATLQARIEEHHAAMAAIDAEFASAQVSPRRQERLEEKREVLEEQVEALYESLDEQHEIFEEEMAEFEEFMWSDEADSDEGDLFSTLEDLGYVDTTADGLFGKLEGLGYVDTGAADWLGADVAECEECETGTNDTWAPSQSRQRTTTEAWLAEVGESMKISAAPGWPAQGQGAALPRSSNGDVIVNVGGGGGGHDAEIVELLREIRDEVRALRADLRSLNGATPPMSTPRASRRADFGYAPSSGEGVGVAAGLDTYAPSAAFGGAGLDTYAPSSGAPSGAFGGSSGAIAPSLPPVDTFGGPRPASGGGVEPIAPGGGFGGAALAPSSTPAPVPAVSPFAPDSLPISTGGGMR